MQAESAPGSAMKGFDLTDLKHYLHIVVRRVWLIALCFIVSLGVSIHKMLQQVDTYRSSAQIVITAPPQLGTRVQIDDRTPFRGLAADYMTTQRQILNSEMLHSRARAMMSDPPSAIRANVQRLRVYTLHQTSIIVIEVTSLDPRIGAEYANAIARAFIEYKDEELLDISQQNILALTQQANRLRDELRKAEDNLIMFRRENRVVALSQRGNLAENTMAQLATRAARHRMERLFLESQHASLQEASPDVLFATLAGLGAGSGGAPAVSVEGSPEAFGSNTADGGEMMIAGDGLNRSAWDHLRRQKVLLESDLAALRRDLRDSHPRVREAASKISDLERRIDLELAFVREQFNSRLESLRVQEEAALRVEREWEEEAIETSRKALAYEALQRDMSRLQRLYDMMYDRLREMDVVVTHQTENIRILNEAQPAARPLQPRRLEGLFMAAMIGIGIGLGLVIGLEFIDDSLRYPEEVARVVGVPLFGVIPSAEWDADDLGSHMLENIDPKSALVEAYRNVRSSMLHSARERPIRTLAFLSAVPKEGKTTTSLNMAISLSQAGARILLVDADMRRGELHKYFGLEGARGLSDVLAGQAKPEAVIQRTGVPGLDMVATGPFPPNPAEVILRAEFKAFLDYGRRSYDYVLLDCPPVMAVSEASVLASMVDAVLFVVWGGHTPKKAVRIALQLLREKGASVLGCVLNNLEFGRAGYYYYAGYYYDSYYREEDVSRTEGGASRPGRESRIVGRPRSKAERDAHAAGQHPAHAEGRGQVKRKTVDDGQ